MDTGQTQQQSISLHYSIHCRHSSADEVLQYPLVALPCDPNALKHLSIVYEVKQEAPIDLVPPEPLAEFTQPNRIQEQDHMIMLWRVRQLVPHTHTVVIVMCNACR